MHEIATPASVRDWTRRLDPVGAWFDDVENPSARWGKREIDGDAKRIARRGTVDEDDAVVGELGDAGASGGEPVHDYFSDEGLGGSSRFAAPAGRARRHDSGRRAEGGRPRHFIETR
jgi:hypothetical protein